MRLKHLIYAQTYRQELHYSRGWFYGRDILGVALAWPLLWGITAGFYLHVTAVPVQANWDPHRYIDVNEVRPGMDAYCLTVFKGTSVERFPLEVVNVVQNIIPGRSAILVVGKDERFIHAGVVAGCSGSPVYIDDRLAGALAFGWTFSKDPLYGVTPIRDILCVGRTEPREGTSGPPETAGHTRHRGFLPDLSRPIDFSEIQKQMEASKQALLRQGPGLSALACPLVVSGISSDSLETLESIFQPYGFFAVAGAAGTPDISPEISLEPGATLFVPLVDGDFKMAVQGTVTHVEDDRVYGFGHPFIGSGHVELPLATGQIYTVVANMVRSFKVGTPQKVVGALTADEPTGVLGHVGAQARTLPVTMRIDHFLSPQTRTFECRLAYDRMLTADLLKSTIAMAIDYFGKLPIYHSLEYRLSFDLEDGPPLDYTNLSTQVSVEDLITEGMATVLLLMNNPYEPVGLTAVHMDVRVLEDNRVSHISMVDLSDTRIKPGESVKVGVVLETFQGKKRRFEFAVTVPDDLAPGEYALTLCGYNDYVQCIKRLAPHRLMALDRRSLIEALDYALHLKRDRLYCLLELPPSGVTVEREELPDLPASKALILQNANRTVHIQPLQTWIEQSLAVGTTTINKETLRLIVEG